MLSGVCEVSPDIRIAHSVAHFYVCHKVQVVILYASCRKSVDNGSISASEEIRVMIANHMTREVLANHVDPTMIK